MKSVEIILSPKELPALAQRDLHEATCVVFDVLRATSTFVTALHHGAKAIVPVSEIAEALAIRQKQPDVLLGGERDGVRIGAAQGGGIDFDLGNSPREYTPEKIGGQTIVSTTTNGTRALRACARAQTVLASSFLNLTATARFLERLQPSSLVLVCAGTRENVATEDVLAAGALAEMLMPWGIQESTNSVKTALDAWQKAKTNLAAAVAEAENARRLLAIPALCDDVLFCLQIDKYPLVARMESGAIIRLPGGFSI